MSDANGKVLDEKDLENVNGGMNDINELSKICASCKTITKWVRGGMGGWKCSECGGSKSWTIYEYNDWKKNQGC